MPAVVPTLSERRSSAKGLNIAVGKPDLTGFYDARGFSGVIGSRRPDRQRGVQKKRGARWMNANGDGNPSLEPLLQTHATQRVVERRAFENPCLQLTFFILRLEKQEDVGI